MAQITRIGALAGVFAAATFAITPAHAAHVADTAPAAASVYALDFEQVAPFDAGAETGVEEAEYHRRYRRYRRNRIDGGDVVAGVLILGGIAAIASAASNNERRERVERQRYDDRRYDDRRDDDRRSNPRASDGSGIDSAVSQCLSAIERDVRVESVDGASRVASGWIVSGTLFNGAGFSCEIDNNGRISNVDYGGYAGAGYQQDGEAAPGQWSEDRYAEARAEIGIQEPDMERTPVLAVADTGPQPAYPGGPLPGEEGYNQ